jgi:hypothetical protein
VSHRAAAPTLCPRQPTHCHQTPNQPATPAGAAPPACCPPPPAVASRLQTALSTVLLHNDNLRDTLVGQLGFAVKVRQGRRRRTASQPLQSQLLSKAATKAVTADIKTCSSFGTCSINQPETCLRLCCPPACLPAWAPPTCAVAGCAHVSRQPARLHSVGQLQWAARALGARVAQAVSEAAPRLPARPPACCLLLLMTFWVVTGAGPGSAKDLSVA